MALYLDAGRVGVGQKGGRWFTVWAVRHRLRDRWRKAGVRSASAAGAGNLAD
jgi:hypothetical protein